MFGLAAFRCESDRRDELVQVVADARDLPGAPSHSAWH